MLSQLAIKYVNVEQLIPYSNNARTHSDEQISQIAKSIKKHGFTNPILLDGKNGIIAGHGRLLAAKKLKLSEVPTIDLSFASDAEKAEYIIADNKLALNADWDFDTLRIEFDLISDAGIDLAETGFSEHEIESLQDNVDFEPTSIDDQGKLDESKPITCPSCKHVFHPKD
jgi:ParB-like chromosome segregation protein Spo0J